MRLLIVNWEDLSSAIEENKLSIFIRDKETGKMKYLECTVQAEYREDGELAPLYNEHHEAWDDKLFKNSDEAKN